ncbi:alpha/beta hydrolase fold protein [Tersicoccus solisilvae]|uniref:Alpha/beta hydrolase fold protein n=1 Tax=Tersicoccus solisilvae TaxID=1882339 RepID=A0ABQ1NT99_9MICC|nr:alpha/beta hydrolase [Tersicoccus solisilvae]GGC82775.1 alpha/beta hydrolase fold protein [Tersicoccus solisilvae]
MDARSATLDLADGRRAPVWWYGDAGAPARTVVLVHGFRGDHHGLAGIAAALASGSSSATPGWRVVVPDLPGFGAAAPFDGRHDVPAYARFVRLVADAVQPGGAPALVGHSFGSIVAAHAVAAGPDAFSSLTLINPIAAPALEGPQALMSRLAQLYYAAGARLPEPIGQALLRNRVIVRLMSEVMATTKDPALRRFIHDQHRRYFSAFADRRVVREAFTASVTGTVTEVAGRLTLPVQLIAGDADDIAPLDTQRRLHTLLPGSELSVIAGVGHLTHYETPELVAGLIGDFLDRHPAATGEGAAS